MILEAIVMFFTEMIHPDEDIDIVQSFDTVSYNENIKE